MSSNYKHLSGASKRRKKAELEEKKRKHPKIDTFLSLSSSTPTNPVISDIATFATTSTSSIASQSDSGKYPTILDLLIDCQYYNIVDVGVKI